MHYLLVPYTLFLLLYIVFLSDEKKNIGRTGIVFVLTLSIALLGFVITIQPFFGDPYRYALGFLKFRDFTIYEIFTYQTGEYLFRLLNWIVGQFTDNPHLLFFVVYVIFILTFYRSLKIIYPSFERYIVFSFYILYPHFLFYVVNGKRQGLGLVFMLLAIGFLMKNENKKAFTFFIVSGLFHSGMFLVLPIVGIFLFFKEKQLLKISFIILMCSIFISILDINEILSGPLLDILATEARYKAYLTDEFTEINYRIGFRLDFTLFSFFPIFLYSFLRKRIHDNEKKEVQHWLALYMLLNSIYHVFSFVPFNDRFAVFSWFILPIVCYMIVRSVSKKYAILFTISILFFNLFLLQTYTGYILHSLEIF